MKLNEWGFTLNWAGRTSWGWWDDTVLQTQNSKFVAWRSEAEDATSRSRKLPTHNIESLREIGAETVCFFETWKPERVSNPLSPTFLHRALCCLFRPDTDGTRVSKCGHLSQQTRRLDPMLFQCWSSAVGGGPILKQHWVKCSRLLGSIQVSVYTHPSATIIFSPADQGTFSKTAGQSQTYYNTWNWEGGGDMTSTICTF